MVDLMDVRNSAPDEFATNEDVQSIISFVKGYPDAGGAWEFKNDLGQTLFSSDGTGVYAAPDDGTEGAVARVLVDVYDLDVGMFMEFNSVAIGDLALFWAVADGTGGTVDRRGRFAVSADGSTFIHGDTGGSATASLTHFHSMAHTHAHGHGIGTMASQNHTHGAGSYGGPSHTHGHTMGVGGVTGTSSQATNSIPHGNTGGATSTNPTNHTHDNGTLALTGSISADGTGGVSGSSASAGNAAIVGSMANDGTASSAANTGSTGSATPILPPYYCITVIQRVA